MPVILDRLRSWFGHSSQVQDQRVTARIERLAERFLDDEALRRELDDATWQPVQTWLLAEVERLARSTASLEDEAAEAVLDSGSSRLRELAMTLVDALLVGAQSPDFVERVEGLRSIVVDPLHDSSPTSESFGRVRAIAERLAATHADGPTAASEITAALAGVVSDTAGNKGDRL